MMKIFSSALVLVVITSFSNNLFAQKLSFTWSRILIDNSRTCCSATNADNVVESIGRFEGKTYISPSGRKFSTAATPKVAAILLAAQEKMADVKKVIAQCEKDMKREYPQSELTNWYIDRLMSDLEARTGKKVDVGITNFGGIRKDLSQGAVLRDDIISMFPFKNYLCRIEIRGKYLRKIFEEMAEKGFQILGGVSITAKDGKILKAKIGGKDIVDEKLYVLATISFLLDGGDGLYLAKNAENLQVYEDYIMDIMLPFVEEYGKRGEKIKYHLDDRIKIISTSGKQEGVRM